MERERRIELMPVCSLAKTERELAFQIWFLIDTTLASRTAHRERIFNGEWAEALEAARTALFTGGEP